MSLRRPDTSAPVRRSLVTSGVAAGAFLLLTVAVLDGARPLLRLDGAVSALAHRTALEHPLWRSAMAAITVTGSTAVIAPLAAVACLLLVWRRRWRLACVIAVALPVTIGIRLLVVTSVARPRPPDPLTTASGWAFPSGHATSSAAAALIAVLVCVPLLRSPWSRALVGVLAAAWAVAVGVSRVALVVHWPTDVIGAWLLVLSVVPAVVVLLGAALRRVGG